MTNLTLKVPKEDVEKLRTELLNRGIYKVLFCSHL